VTKDEWAAARGMRTPGAGRKPPLFGDWLRELPMTLADHVTRWCTADGGSAVVLQPYGLDEERMGRLAGWCERHGLRADVDLDANWHNPGEVVGVVVWLEGTA
jgi:hypothetical protein